MEIWYEPKPLPRSLFEGIGSVAYFLDKKDADDYGIKYWAGKHVVRMVKDSNPTLEFSVLNLESICIASFKFEEHARNYNFSKFKGEGKIEKNNK